MTYFDRNVRSQVNGLFRFVLFTDFAKLAGNNVLACLVAQSNPKRSA